MTQIPMPIQSARIRFGTSRRRQKGSAPPPRRFHGRARCVRDHRPDLGPDRPKSDRILARYFFDNKWIFHIEFGAILGAFPGRPGGGDSARKEREGGAEPQGEDGGGAHDKAADAARARGRGSIKIGRRGPECREASGARRRRQRLVTPLPRPKRGGRSGSRSRTGGRARICARAPRSPGSRLFS